MLLAKAPDVQGVVRVEVDVDVSYKAAKEALLEAFERAYVNALMERHGGNVTRAAAAAELSRKHLHQLIRKVGP